MTTGRVRYPQQDIEEIQRLRYSGASLQEIQTYIPWVNESILASLAPGELRGKRKRVAEYVRDNPGVNFTDIPYRQMGVNPHETALHLYFLRRASLATFTEKKSVTSSNGHGQAGGSNEKGIFDIHLTQQGYARLSHRLRKDILDKVVEKVLVSPITPNSHTDTETYQQPPMGIVEAPTPIVEESTPQREQFAYDTHSLTPRTEPAQFPMLMELRSREGKLSEAISLLQKASNLMADAGMTEEGLKILEDMSKTSPKFTPLELEYMRFANDC